MGGSWIIFWYLLVIISWECTAITNKRQPHPYEDPVRDFRHIADSPSTYFHTDWEVGLREATNQALLRERYQDPNLRDHLQRAPLIGKQDTATPFGDVAILARGQLYVIHGGNFVFVQDPYQNDCDDCHNAARKRCVRHQCETFKPHHDERLVALWTVKRLRHRGYSDRPRYEIEYTISPVNSVISEGFIARNGRFDYAVPGHVFVIKQEFSQPSEAHPVVYNQRTPHRHFRPEVLIGAGPDGYKHVLHSYPGFYTSLPVHPTFHQQGYSTNDPKETELYKALIEALAVKTSTTQKIESGPHRFSLNQYGGVSEPKPHRTYPTKPPYDSFFSPQTPLVQLTTGNVASLTQATSPITEATSQAPERFPPTIYHTVGATKPMLPTYPTQITSTETTKHIPKVTKPIMTTIHYFAPVEEEHTVTADEIMEMQKMAKQTAASMQKTNEKPTISTQTTHQKEGGEDFPFPVVEKSTSVPKTTKKYYKSTKATPTTAREEDGADFLFPVVEKPAGVPKTTKKYYKPTTTTVQEEDGADFLFPIVEKTNAPKTTKKYYRPTTTKKFSKQNIGENRSLGAEVEQVTAPTQTTKIYHATIPAVKPGVKLTTTSTSIITPKSTTVTRSTSTTKSPMLVTATSKQYSAKITPTTSKTTSTASTATTDKTTLKLSTKSSTSRLTTSKWTPRKTFTTTTSITTSKVTTPKVTIGTPQLTTSESTTGKTTVTAASPATMSGASTPEATTNITTPKYTTLKFTTTEITTSEPYRTTTVFPVFTKVKSSDSRSDTTFTILQATTTATKIIEVQSTTTNSATSDFTTSTLTVMETTTPMSTTLQQEEMADFDFDSFPEATPTRPMKKSMTLQPQLASTDQLQPPPDDSQITMPISTMAALQAIQESATTKVGTPTQIVTFVPTSMMFKTVMPSTTEELVSRAEQTTTQFDDFTKTTDGLSSEKQMDATLIVLKEEEMPTTTFNLPTTTPQYTEGIVTEKSQVTNDVASTNDIATTADKADITSFTTTYETATPSTIFTTGWLVGSTKDFGTTTSTFLTENGSTEKSVHTKHINEGYDEDDIFGTTKVLPKPTNATSRKTTESEFAGELFGTRKGARQYRTEPTETKNTKIIYADFFEASTTPVAHTTEVTSTSEKVRETTVVQKPSQSYRTAISFKVNKRNRTKEEGEMRTTNTLKEVISTARTTELTDVTTSIANESTSQDSKKVFDEAALQLINHARRINYTSRSNDSTSRPKYKRRRNYIPKNRKVSAKSKQ